MKNLLFIWIWMIGLTMHAQIPNSGFEYWQPGPVPANWSINSHPMTMPPWDPYVIRQDSDRYAGRYAVNLLTNGHSAPQTWIQLPITTRPDSLSLYYKSVFPPCVNDVGYRDADTVAVELTFTYQGNVVRRVRWQTQQTQLNFTRLTIPIPGFSQAIDTCEIRLIGGKVFGGCGIIAAATSFVVDEVKLFPQPCFDSTAICLSCPCPQVIAPVCGCDSITYTNSCEALTYHGITSWTNGPCSSPAPACTSLFAFSKQKDTVTFVNLSQAGVIYRYRWSFGDGDTSAILNPVHVYANEGDYQVCLIIEVLDQQGRSCTDTFCNMVYVTRGCIDTSLICDPPMLCCDAPLFEPVCGCNGQTYDNACIAYLLNGVTATTPGPCSPSGIPSLEEDKLRVWPNPGNGKISLKADQPIFKIQIYHVGGSLWWEAANAEISNPSVSIQIENWPAGCYWIRCTLSDGKIRQVLYFRD